MIRRRSGLVNSLRSCEQALQEMKEENPDWRFSALTRNGVRV
jgi:hypothetical protein